MSTIKQDQNGRYVIPPDMIGIANPVKIKEATKYDYYDVETRTDIYRRYGILNWEKAIGERFEKVDKDEAIELEQAFREYFEDSYYGIK